MQALAAADVAAPGSPRLLRRFHDNVKQLARANRILAAATAAGEPVPGEANWLLDNFYILREVVREIQTDLPRGYFRELPAVVRGPDAGVPRVYPLAAAVLAHADSAVTDTQVRDAVRLFQEVSPLSIGETWAVPTMLRLGLIETLRRLSDETLDTLAARRAAATGRPPAHASDAYTLARAAVAADTADPVPLADVAAARQREGVRQAANMVSIGNAVTSLRLLGVLDWAAFFEATSPVEATLRGDPGGVHPNQDFATRDRCRRAVERLARGAKKTDHEVAALAVAAARAAAPDPVRGLTSWHLIGDGQPAFARSLGYRPAWGNVLREKVLKYPGTAYFLTLATLTFAPLAALGGWTGEPWVILAALLPVSEAAVTLANAAIARLVPPRVLSRLNSKTGVPSGGETFVVIPSLLGKPADAATLCERLELHYLSNPDAKLWFGLLTDFTDAPTETTPTDDATVAAAVDGIARLNARYAAGQKPRFFLFHRRRKFHAADRVWMGWERKRGKLDEFNRVLRGATDTSYSVFSTPANELPWVQYVLTLDADTVLPRDAAKSMIAALAHPLNHPQLSKDGRRVAAGYAVLQPRVSFLYRTGFRSLFARAFAGSAGVDPYSAAVSDTYMDLFARGTFTGKGLYDVDAFAATGGRAFPENRILSHDLIESAYARCGLATDVEVFDGFPSRYHAFAKRDHRWTRGDWQLLPWLGRTVPTPDGRADNVLPPLERWKIIDNLRRSLVPAGCVLLAVLGWTVLPGPAWLWTLLAVLPFVVPTVVYVVRAGMRLLGGETLHAERIRANTDLVSTTAQAALQVAFLVNHATILLDAIGRTLWRLTVTRRKMLEWETAAATDTRLGDDFRSYLRFMLPGLVAAALAAGVVVALAPANLLPAAPLLVAWLAAPAIAYYVSRPRTPHDPPLDPATADELKGHAAKVWKFFERFVGPDDNGLPPDNYQEDPRGEVATRTSPTNVGLYLLACLAARDLGFIDSKEVVRRVRAAFDALDKLKTFRGHLFNWYDTRTLAALLPRYVSTVDSGNLLACLLTAKQGLLEPVPDPADADALRQLAARAERWAGGMDFRFLFDTERELFVVGYDTGTGRADPYHYDLLASEACITSFLAVARGEAPRKHWFTLGRLITRAAGETTLVSWGGTMFEYLTPRLLLPVPPGVLLDIAQRGAVGRQIEFGERTGKPWGISESGFYTFDAERTYQYQSFGVPGLGLKRGLEKDHVVAPYATLMAADIDPAAAVANLRRLRAEGGEGEFGFYEAIDYTSGRVPIGGRRVVKQYMAHHQGMALLAVTNRLTGGVMRERLRREPAVRAAELLLEERVPAEAPLESVAEAIVEVEPPTDGVAAPTVRRVTAPDTPTPRTHLLSNGRFATLMTNAGGGFARWNGLDLTRWRADRTADGGGPVVYLRDRTTGASWSVGHLPTRRRPERYEVAFSVDKADIRRHDDGIEALLEVTVPPDHDAEVRRLTLTNTGRRPRTLDVTSFLELALAPHAADLAHPAFHKLFLETEWVPEHAAVLCRRRPRDDKQTPLYAVHVLSIDGDSDAVTCETDRNRFVGRHRSPADPRALDPDVTALSGVTGPVLDPVFALRVPVRLTPGQTIQLAFTTGAAATRDAAVALADHFHDPLAVARAFDVAWAHARIDGPVAEDVHLFQRLAGHLLFPCGPLRPADAAAANTQGQPGLWKFGVSGDSPILILRLTGPNGVPLFKQVLAAFSYWAARTLGVELVVLLENAGGYYDDLFAAAAGAVRAAGLADRLDKPNGVFLRKARDISDADQSLLLACARAVLDDRAGPLAAQADALDRPTPLPQARPAPPLVRPGPPPLIGELRHGTTFGGFTADGRAYVVTGIPPAPWANVIATPDAGFVATDSGGGVVWSGNSQTDRLTPWANDPVSDPPGDIVYVQDDDTGAFWCPTPLPAKGGGPVTVSHAAGVTTYTRTSNDIESVFGVFAAGTAKASRLTLRNRGPKAVRLAVTYYAELVLGTDRETTAHHVTTWADPAAGLVFARNPYRPAHGDAVAVLASSLAPAQVTGDRAEFLGRCGSPANPAALNRTGLSGRTGPGLDPCAAVRGVLTLNPGEERIIGFVLGSAGDEVAARKLAKLAEPNANQAVLADAVAGWDDTLTAVQVRTPDPAFDALLNRWLVYQTLGCRVRGRTAVYQSGGAFGFRDQLQDVAALVHARPADARAQIVRAASRQFREGDVQHWWHEPAGNGVRTRFSDDFLWLPLVACRYAAVTGDVGVFDEVVPFLESLPLAPHEHERYEVPAVSGESADVYEHCRRAFAHGWQLGPHGLPLMGVGDWNDGMNAVGIGGTGESVWVAWFQIVCMREFVPVAEARGDAATAATFRDRIAALTAAVEQHAWDGAWYRRAYYDDGTPLGSATGDECQIDSLAQSWAVFAGTGDPDRAKTAMDSVLARLVKADDRLVLLFDPPFDHGAKNPGYIKGYVPGVRENGGQYTHAAIWVAAALADAGRGEDAYRVFDLINPIRATDTDLGVSRYRGEPYVVAADVYGRWPHAGRAGWTWYTGSSGWLYRAGLEHVLGLERRGDRLRVRPAVPAAWESFTIRYRFGQSVYVLQVERPAAVRAGAQITVDGRPLSDDWVPLVDDGREHLVTIRPRG